MASTATLSILLTLKDKASKGLDKSEKQLKGYQKAAAGVGIAMMGMGVAVGGASMKMAADVGSAYTILQAGTGATASQMETLKATFNRTYKSVAADMGTTATVIADLNTQLGLEGVALESMSHQMLEAARMTRSEPVSANLEFARAVKAWQLPVSEAPIMLDKMFVAGQKTGVGIAGLSKLMTDYGSGLRQLGFSTNEAISMLSGLYTAGYPVSRIMPAMAMASRKFAESNVPLNEGLKTTISQMQGAETDARALSIAMGVFGAEGATALTDAVRSGAFSLTALEGDLASSSGAVERFSAATEDTYTKMAKLQHETEMMSASLGTALLPAVEPLVRIITPILGHLAAFTEKYSTLSAVILASVTAGGGLILLLALLPKIQAGYATLKGTMLALQGAHLAAAGAAGTQATAERGLSASLAASGVAAMKSVAGLMAAAAAKIWSWAAAIPVVGVGVGMAAIAAITASIFALKSKLTGLAEGGKVTQGGAFVVGERGKEIVNLPAGSAVTPLPAGAGFGGEGGFTIRIENMTVRGEADIEAIAEELYRKQKAAERSWGIKGNE